MSPLATYQAREAARAKINLSLEVLARRPDGYHELRSLMVNTELADQLFLSLKVAPGHLSEAPGGVLPWTLESDHEAVPRGASNSCHKAARLFFGRVGVAPQAIHLDLFIEKKIPLEAGLGGGSADAAALLRLLWRAWHKDLARDLGQEPDRLTLEDLDAIALETGADVPFCLRGGLRLCQGLGQILSPPLQAPAWPLLIVKPAASVSTAWAFAHFDQRRQEAVKCQLAPGGPQEAEIWQPLLESSPLTRLSPWIHNDFQKLMEEKVPAIAHSLQALEKTNAPAFSMTGTGSACFALYEGEAEAQAAYRLLSGTLKESEVIMTRLAPCPEAMAD